MTAKTRAEFQADKDAKIEIGVPAGTSATEIKSLLTDLGDSAVFPADAILTDVIAESAATAEAIAAADLVKNYTGTVPPDETDDFAAGYSLLSSGLDTVTGKRYTCTGDGVWRLDLGTADVSEGGLSGLLQDMDPPVGSMAVEDATAYPTFAKQEVQVIDCAGDINKTRVTVNGKTPLTSVLCKWKNNPGGQKPTNAVNIDEWDGPPVGVQLTQVLAGTALTLGPTVVGYNIRCTNETKAIVTLPADATASYDTDAGGKIIRTGAVVEIKAGTGATINGVTNARFEINTQFAWAEFYKSGPNAWILQITDVLTPLAAGAEVTYPIGAGSLATDGDDYVLTLLGDTGASTVSGTLSITGADLNVWLLQQAPGGSSGRSDGNGGASGGQTYEDETLTLTVNDYAFSIGPPGAEQITTSSRGFDGGDCVFNGVTCVGGKKGGRAGEAGFPGPNGSGAGHGGAANTTTFAGGTASAGFAGGQAGNSPTAGLRASGGGGGSGSTGGAGNTTTGKGGAGGNGFASLIEGGAGQYYGAGGPGGGGTTTGDLALGHDYYGNGSYIGTGTGGVGSRAGGRGAIILRFAIADCASEPQAV